MTTKLNTSGMLARAFRAEGVDHLFTLMGDANMYWSTQMAEQPGMSVVHARHEHAAVAMADGYARATGKVGVASTTCGPGFTQIMTALTCAARANTPLVVFAGDSPIAANWYLQQIDMAPLTLATGAHYVPIRHIDRLHDNVREAFQVAQAERRPVVLSVPLDMQRLAWPHSADYRPSSDLVPMDQRPIPDPAIVDRVVDMIARAEKPIIVGGRGAVWAGAKTEIEALAEAAGALLATSLLAKGLFNGNPYSLDLAGGFASDFTRARFAEADLVISFGASLGYFTQDTGKFFGKAKVVQVDAQPKGLWQGLKTADLHVRADARTTAAALLDRLQQRNVKRTGFRTAEMARLVAADVPDAKQFPVQPGTVDPRRAIEELDRTIPKDWDLVIGGGHYFSIATTHIKNRAPDKMHVFVDFGAIGSALPAAIGIAKARGDGKVALIEGDGSIMLHVQELETVRRQGIQMLVAIMNDGGYGAEFHKFRANNIDPTGAMHGRGDIAAVATGFGLRGANVNALGRMEGLFQEHRAANISTLWDVHIDDKIPSRYYRRVHFGEA